MGGEQSSMLNLFMKRYEKMRQRIQMQYMNGEGYAFQKVFHTPYQHVDQNMAAAIKNNNAAAGGAQQGGGMGGAFGGGGMGGSVQVAHVVQTARHNNEAMQRRQFPGDNGQRQVDPRSLFVEGLYLRDPAQAYKEVLAQKPMADRASERHREIEIEELDQLRGKPWCRVQFIEERVRDFGGLDERRKLQVQRSLHQEKRLKELQERLDKVVRDQQKSVHLRVERMREEYMEERDRLIKVVARLELLKGPHQRTRNGNKETPLTIHEEQFRERLEQMRSQLEQPGQYNARLESLDKLQYLEHRPQEVSWNAFSEEDKRRIVEFLKYQKNALQIMTEDVRQKERHLEVMQEFYDELNGR